MVVLSAEQAERKITSYPTGSKSVAAIFIFPLSIPLTKLTRSTCGNVRFDRVFLLSHTSIYKNRLPPPFLLSTIFCLICCSSPTYLFSTSQLYSFSSQVSFRRQTKVARTASLSYFHLRLSHFSAGFIITSPGFGFLLLLLLLLLLLPSTTPPTGRAFSKAPASAAGTINKNQVKDKRRNVRRVMLNMKNKQPGISLMNTNDGGLPNFR